MENYDNLKDIYNIALHEMIDVGDWAVTRVPGGWIYFDKNPHIAVFVPFNNEFIVKEK